MNMLQRAFQYMNRRKISAIVKTEKQADKKSVSGGKQARKVRDAKGTVTLYDVRLKSLGGMRIDAIRRCYGINAAKYVSKMDRAQANAIATA